MRFKLSKVHYLMADHVLTEWGRYMRAQRSAPNGLRSVHKGHEPIEESEELENIIRVMQIMRDSICEFYAVCYLMYYDEKQLTAEQYERYEEDIKRIQAWVFHMMWPEQGIRIIDRQPLASTDPVEKPEKGKHYHLAG